ncbi:ABC transporter-like protein [Bifidobacterium adolescentis]|nr:ABC transporter-like protein [Bifidobacterium adolescentis]
MRENIRYGKLDATDEEIVAAAKAVHAHEFIMELPDGYDTVVEERGSTLSAGQRQLIAFARVLLADPRILILDEATSNIDTRTEEALQAGLNHLLKGRTSFIIAHSGFPPSRTRMKSASSTTVRSWNRATMPSCSPVMAPTIGSTNRSTP